jgi:hypothetical protein
MSDFAFTTANQINGGIINIVPADGIFTAPPTWVSSDATVFSPTVAADGLSCTGKALKGGTVTITVSGNGIVKSHSVTFSDLVTGFDFTFVIAPPPPPPAP